MYSLNVKRGRSCRMRRMGYLNCRNHGTNEQRRYGNGQEYTEGDFGILFICVCAEVGAFEERNHGGHSRLTQLLEIGICGT